MNHEAITPLFLHPTGQTIAGTGSAAARTVADEVLREFYLHGVSVIEVNKSGSTWSYKQDSTFNRRVHTLTEMTFSGPAAQDRLPEDQVLDRRQHDARHASTTAPTATRRGAPTSPARRTGPATSAASRPPTTRSAPPKEVRRFDALRRGRHRPRAVGHGHARHARQPRTAAGTPRVLGATAGSDDYRNGANTYGWVVEIDPFAPDRHAAQAHRARPLRRTKAPGSARSWPASRWSGTWATTRATSTSTSSSRTPDWDPADAARGLAAGDKYLDDGKLYVAKFNADGTGDVAAS